MGTYSKKMNDSTKIITFLQKTRTSKDKEGLFLENKKTTL